MGGLPAVCDDTNICTDDSCDPGMGCVFTPNLAPCDDGNACTTADACAGGICQGGSPPACNDANVCTDDGCDPGSGCTFTPNTDPCDDGNACTTADTCSGSVCQAGPPLVCDDANACTQDSCDTLLGCVVEGPQICPVPATSAWGRVLLAVSLLAGALTVRRR